MSEDKYPRLTQMPYYNTKVEAERTKAEILLLLKKYEVEDHQWTSLKGKENLRFIIDTTVQGQQIRVAVEFEIPQIKAVKGPYHEIVEVPGPQRYRIFYYSLKSLLEATKYGIFSKKDLFWSFILTQLPDGSLKTLKDRVEEEIPLLLHAGRIE